MKIINIISRVIVVGIFFVSGLIKANDILGFSYKLEEYFSAEVFDMPFMEHFVVPLAVLVCVGEIVLGLAVILGAKMKLATWSLFAFTVFFAFLTWYSAFYDKVKECGCFGDALSMTPWQSFYKDIFLMFFVVILLFSAKRIKLNTSKEDMIMGGLSLLLISALSIGIFNWTFPVVFFIVLFAGALLIKKLINHIQKEWIMAVFVALASMIFGYYTFNYLPIKDYRAYAIGKSITEQMKTAEDLGLEPPTYYNLYTLVKESGESRVVRSDDYLKEKLWKDKSWKIDKTKTEGPFVATKGYEPAIADFKIDSYDDEDLTHQILEDTNPTLLVIFKDVSKVNIAKMSKLNRFLKEVEGKMKIIGLSPSGYDEAEQFRHDNDLAFPFYSGDQIVLKTMVRANPGVILIQGGTVVNKWHINAIPTLSELLASAK